MEFDESSKEYLFTHVTSSQKLPQANGEAERAVQTIKNALKKEKDPAKALMSYRAAPLENGNALREKNPNHCSRVARSAEAFLAWLTGTSRAQTRKQDCPNETL